jgi:hypothetical protein
MGKRKVKENVGDVFGVPLKDGSRAIAQVIESIDSLRAALCVFYSYRIHEVAEGASFPFSRTDVVAVQTVSTRPMLKGEWDALGNAPVANADLRRVLNGLRESGYVGLDVPNSNTIEALMNAHHELGPWEIGSDTDFLRRLVYRQS